MRWLVHAPEFFKRITDCKKFWLKPKLIRNKGKNENEVSSLLSGYNKCSDLVTRLLLLIPVPQQQGKQQQQGQ